MNFKKYHVSRNLFDWNWLVNGYHLDPQTGLPTTHPTRVSILQPIDVSQLTTATISYESINVETLYTMYSVLTIENTLIRRVTSVASGSTLDLSEGDKLYITFYNGAPSGANAITKDNITNIMLNTGSVPLPYEPYSSDVWHDIPHYIHNTSTDTITTLPAVLYPNDTTATVGLKGQMEQNGTPAPQNPITPSECGERTVNLFDKDNVADRRDLSASTGNIVNGQTKCVSDYIEISENTSYTTHNVTTYVLYNNLKEYLSGLNIETGGIRDATIDNTNGKYIRIACEIDDKSTVMLNSGSTALPYEPFGVKIPISSANTTTPVYLGEVESTRRIYKLVLTGRESWNANSTGNTQFFFTTVSNETILNSEIICTHFENANIGQTTTVVGIGFAGTVQLRVRPENTSAETVISFKQWLIDQYAAGTPVTVWYVLATPTTGIVNEPIRKIGDYADEVSGITIPTIAGANTISVGTTLQPSEVSVNYHGWHPVQSVHEYDSNYTIATMQALTIAQLQTHTISELQGGEWS